MSQQPSDRAAIAREYERALSSIGRGDAEIAEEILLRIQRIDPGFVPARYTLGGLAVARGDLEQGTREFLAVLEVDPLHVDSHMQLAGILARQGRFASAIGACDHVLGIVPALDTAWLGKGDAQLAAGDAEGALKTYAQAEVAGVQGPVLALPRSRAFEALGRYPEGLSALEEVGETSAAVLDLRARLLLACDDAEGAAGQYRLLIEQFGASASRLRNLALAQDRGGALDDALASWNGCLELNETDYVALTHKAAILGSQGALSEARVASLSAISCTPLRRRKAASGTGTRSVLLLRALGPGYFQMDGAMRPVLQRENALEGFLTDGRYDVTELYLERWDHDPDCLHRVPRPSVIINGVADADRHADTLSILPNRLVPLGVPVINRPEAVARTRRDAISRLLAPLDGLMVPKVLRLTLTGRLTFLDSLSGGYPWIVRRAGTHRGGSMERVDNADAADDWFSRHGAIDAEIYVISYVDNRFRRETAKADLWRRFRLLAVGGELIPITLHFHDHWNVHSNNRGPLMLNDAELVRLEERFIVDPGAVIGEQAMDHIAHALALTELDYVGMDFDLLPDGRVLVFEVNSAMAPQRSLVGNSPYLGASLDRIAAAMDRLIDRHLETTGATRQ
ncbi:MAG: hypothetical protein ACPGUC_00630 [Gammaproteobacteria bacterium]